MKNILCPVSSERINDSMPRINALLTSIILLLYAITNSLILPAFLVVDFFIRGYGNSNYSILAILSKRIYKNFTLKGNIIDKAPKIFAARLGFIFSILILFIALLGFNTFSLGLSFILIVFASLECIANICVGCLIYTWFIYPFSKNQILPKS